MATPSDKDALTPEECAQAAPKLECPRCGLVAEGLRCPRCNAVKVGGCEGSCGGCTQGCSERRRG